MPKPATSIAVFRALQLGDLLCAIPALRAIRNANPGARITLIGLPWARDFVHRIPYVDDFLAFPGFPGLPERVPDLPRVPYFLAKAQARQFDLAIQLHGSGRLTNPLVALLGARQMAGFFTPGEWRPDNGDFLAWPEGLPEIRRLLALTEHLGYPSCGEALELPILPEERRAFLDLRARLPVSRRGYVCVHPGARLATRRWLPERFALVADRLALEGFSVILTGSASEAALVADIRQHMATTAIDLAGHTTLGTLAALVAGAELVVCNDTGMSHIADAVGTSSVVVCSGSDPERWQPLNHQQHRTLWHPVPCRPCAHHHCPTAHECAAGIGADMVIEMSLDMLPSPAERRHAAR
jgi:ADP-heptose:LPS heptosyltransferase